ncbi:MAG TPA: acetoacetate--CoA ligase [Pseudonocardiaceae bacterium]|nr:acetoacetate--CoA ligase [Pseudonocardiaceae bacterium]
MLTEDVLWQPPADARRSTPIGRYLEWLGERGRDFADYDSLWQWSVDDLDGFWRSVWDYFAPIHGGEATRAIDEVVMPGARWFPGVTVNYAENVLRGDDDRPALVAVSQTRSPVELSLGELRDQVARAAAGLRRLGVRPGDRVVAYLPNIPEAVVSVLACASVGAIFSVCSPEFGIASVLARFGQLDPVVLITVDGYRYGSRVIDRAADVAALERGLPSLRAVVNVPYLHDRADGLAWDEFLREPAEPSYQRLDFNAPLWVLFSSGTTGLPKAIVHSHGGILVELLKCHAFHNDLRPGDRYFIHCSTSWVMWSILVGGLLAEASIVLFDGNPDHPAPGGMWQVCATTRTSVFGCGAAWLLTTRQRGQVPGRDHDLSALRGIFSTGSPLPAEGFRWVYEAVGADIYLQSGSGGTDVCTGFVQGSPLVEVRAGTIACRALGVAAEAFDPSGRPVVGALGELVITKPMPSMPVYFWNDPDGAAYRAAYFERYPGVWHHGDWIRFDERGGSVITGRSDGTLNRGGVRLGTSDFYAVVEDFPEIADSLVLHLEADDGVGRLLLFVRMADGSALDDDLRARISGALREQVSPRHRPDEILAVPDIPYGLTGKKLEVPVKRLLQGQPRDQVMSTGAVRNPDSLAAFEALAAAWR